MQRFWGHSENAVRTQLYIAITAYLNVAIFKEVHKIKHSNCEILQILSLTGVSTISTQINASDGKYFISAMMSNGQYYDYDVIVIEK
jgi:hypothetical protein